MGKSSQKAGIYHDITIPPMFFKIAVRKDEDGKPIVLAFLMPNQKKPHGDIQDYLVSVDMIEALTGLDFFRKMDDMQEQELEATDTWKNWTRF